MIVNTAASYFSDGNSVSASSTITVELYEFKPFRKIPRLSRDVVITEKIDGTNAHVFISEDLKTVLAGSRNRYVTPGKATDNYGFAAWVEEHKEELLKLGPGRHYGEWYGKGINRGYGLEEKRFALFNPKWTEERPSCTEVVPVLYNGLFTTDAVDAVLEQVKKFGSMAAPGFMDPEGIVIFHTASGQYFKKTVIRDQTYKGNTDVPA